MLWLRYHTCKMTQLDMPLGCFGCDTQYPFITAIYISRYKLQQERRCTELFLVWKIQSFPIGIFVSLSTYSYVKRITTLNEFEYKEYVIVSSIQLPIILQVEIFVCLSTALFLLSRAHPNTTTAMLLTSLDFICPRPLVRCTYSNDKDELMSLEM